MNKRAKLTSALLVGVVALTGCAKSGTATTDATLISSVVSDNNEVVETTASETTAEVPFSFTNYEMSIEVPVYARTSHDDLEEIANEHVTSSGTPTGIRDASTDNHHGWSRNHELNSQGLIIAYTRGGSDSSGSCTIEYDEYGQVITEYLPYSEIYYTYDDYGNLIHKIVSYSTDETEYTYDIDLNDNGQTSSGTETSSSSSGSYVFTNDFAYVYDAWGRVSEESYYVMDRYGEFYTEEYCLTTYEYDELGNVIQTVESHEYNIADYFEGNMHNTYVVTSDNVNELVGYYTLSPENFSYLNNTSEWVAYDGYDRLPTLDSCINTVGLTSSSDSEFSYLLHINRNMRNQYINAYKLILTEICGLTVVDNGTDMVVSDDNGTIATITYSFEYGVGYYLTISLA